MQRVSYKFQVRQNCIFFNLNFEPDYFSDKASEGISSSLTVPVQNCRMLISIFVIQKISCSIGLDNLAIQTIVQHFLLFSK